MDKLFNMTTFVTGLVVLLVYFMVVAPMLVKKETTAPATNSDGTTARY